MTGIIIATFGAFWLGILTSISPCPLATNIVAISFIARKVESPGKVFLTGLLYTTGRIIAYTILAIILIKGLLSTPLISAWLQKYMNRILGPILILTGMILLELLKLKLPNSKLSGWTQTNAEEMAGFGSIFLGFIFALSFCPVSAAIYFGSLLPLSIKHSSEIMLPFIYGIGTAIPVFAFGVIVAVCFNSIGRAYALLSGVEFWARKITGVAFLLVGMYFTLAYTLMII